MTALRDAIDTTTLGWIKPELDETLRQARMDIEAFAEDPADTARMRFCAGFLHQVHGTLRMVELYAPAMVAEEMERLAAASGPEFDRLFLEFMIKHHEGALVMVKELLSNPGAAQESEIFSFASDVDADQRMEIDRMGAMLKELQK